MSMDIKKELKNPLNQQYIAEILFPFIGYLFFDWSLLIIVVFYLLDQLASQILFYKRLYTINQYWNEKNGVFYLLISIVLFVIVFATELYFLNNSFSFISDQNGICYVDELQLFSKNELWFLFPFLLLMYHLQDKMLFYMPRKFEHILPKNYTLINLLMNIIIMVLIIMATYIYPKTQLPNIAVIFCIVAVKLLFDYTFKKINQAKLLV